MRELLAILFVVAILWWLRWFILATAVITVVVLLIRWAWRTDVRHRAAEEQRLAAIRRRADIQNDQILRGDPAGFFGAHPLPDPELIPAWYTIDNQPKSRQGRRRQT